MTPVQRKRKTEALLIRKGIPYLSWLPCIEPEEETELRTAEEIGIRIFCLFCVIGTAFDPADSSYKLYLRKQRLWDHLTRNELAFLMNPAPNRELCNNHCWRAEAAFILMWVVSLFKRLRFPVRPVANEALVDKLPSFGKSPWPFIHSLKLRPKS
jgi:hypothetical protein